MATKAELASRYMRDKLAKIKRLPVGEALDLLVAQAELEGVLKYQLPAQQRIKKEEVRQAKMVAWEERLEEARANEWKHKQAVSEGRSIRAKQMWAKRAQLNGELK